MRHHPTPRPVILLLVAATVLAGLAVASPAVADDVHLTNGEVFEGVIARRVGETVRVRLDFGEITLPAHRVERIVEADSALAGYLARRAELGADAPAAAWVELARWAERRGLAQGVREASLEAARRDPDTAHLAPLMASQGYGRDEATGRWLPEAELMARRGYVRDGDGWISREVAEARARERIEAHRLREEELRRRRAERLEEAVTMLALRELAEAAREDEPETSPWTPYAPFGFGTGAVVVVGPYAGSPGHRGGHGGGRGGHGGHRGGGERPGHGGGTTTGGHHHGGRSAASPSTYDNLAGRQPGSIIPITVDPGSGKR